MKYDIIVGQNKKTEKEYDELKGEMKDMKKEVRSGVPSQQQQPENSLQQLATKEKIKLQAYEAKKEIDRKNKTKADKQKQKLKQDNVNSIANMQGGFGFTMEKNSKVSMACNSEERLATISSGRSTRPFKLSSFSTLTTKSLPTRHCFATCVNVGLCPLPLSWWSI